MLGLKGKNSQVGVSRSKRYDKPKTVMLDFKKIKEN